MFKKITVLAMALGALAAFVLPVSASAFWQHGAVDLGDNVQIPITGENLRFQSQLGGVECDTTSMVQFKAGTTTGTVDWFKEDEGKQTTEVCKGIGGLAFCQIHELTATERVQDPTTGSHTDLRWILHTTGAQPTAQITVTTGTIHSTGKGAFCTGHEITLTPGTVHFDVAGPEQNGVKTAQLTGQLPGDVDDVPINTTVSGTIHVEGQAAGTYGL